MPENITITPEQQKTAFIAIIGRPNVGKSTLLNTLLGQKISIVSNKPQTTRSRIMGVLTQDMIQYVFVDTPGVHKPHNKLGERMMWSIRTAMEDVELILFVTDGLRAGGEIDHTDAELMRGFAKSGQHVILIVNKCDKLGAERTGECIAKLTGAGLCGFDAVVPISARSGYNCDALSEEMRRFAKPEPWYFPPDTLTDQPERSIAAELVREQLLRMLEHEIPHGIAVSIEDFAESGKLLSIRAIIYCERAAHRQIVIGHNGEMIKRVGTAAREALEAFFDIKVYLDLWVKAKENWRDNEAMLNSFGFGEE